MDLPGLLDQIDDFTATLGSAGADSDDTYFIWAGANDFFDVLTGIQEAEIDSIITAGVSNLITSVSTLNSLGADKILLANLVNLGIVPVIPENVREQATNLSFAFNNALETALDSLDFDVTLLDFFSLSTTVISNPEDFGFSNVEDPLLLEATPPSNPEEFFFFDSIHPTTQAHDIFAEAISQVVEGESIESVFLVSQLSGEQEVDEGDNNASGNATLRLNEVGTGLSYTLTVTGLDFGANGLIDGGSQTPETEDDVTRIHIHNAPRGENGGVAFSLFDIVAPELGNELDIQGNQDEDLEVVLNEDGSVTLTGVWEETDSTNNPLSEFVDEIRQATNGEDLPLYWNIHTEEFPAGAIRGQLQTEQILDDPFFRFQNSGLPGTYFYAGEEESQNVRDNFSPLFVEEGRAFNISLTSDDDLIQFNRFRNNISGSYLYAGEEESQSIRDNFSDVFIEEGIAFYAFGADENQAEDVIRFRNLNIPGAYLFATGEEANSIRANFSDVFVEEGVAFEVAI